jgi:low temperature requirement protein LtrA
VLRLALPDRAGLAAFFVLVVADLAVPIWAERAGPMTRWHPGHIAERYGLFTLIVLGEAILAATTAVQAGLTAGGASPALLGVAAGGLLLVFGLWWVYFARSAGEALRATPGLSFLWGYGHYLVFAAVGAFGGGLEVATESVLHEARTGSRTAAFAVAVPVAVTLLVVGALQVRLAAGRAVLARCAAGAGLVLLAALVPALWLSVLLMGVTAGLLVVAEIVSPEAGDWSGAEQPVDG